MCASSTLVWQLGFHITHIFRKANSVADYLAILTSSTMTSSDFDVSSLSTRLRGLLALDRVQFLNVRFRTIFQSIIFSF